MPEREAHYRSGISRALPASDLSPSGGGGPLGHTNRTSSTGSSELLARLLCPAPTWHLPGQQGVCSLNPGSQAVVTRGLS